MRFVPNPLLAAELEAGMEHQAGMKLIGEAVKKRGESFSPRHTEGYANSWVVIQSATKVTVGNTDFFAHGVEYGSVNNPIYAPLRRAVQAAGLRFVEEGR